MNVIEFITSVRALGQRGLRIRNLFNGYALAKSKEDKIVIRKALSVEVEELCSLFKPGSYEKFVLEDMIATQKFSKKLIMPLAESIDSIEREKECMEAFLQSFFRGR